MLCKYLSEASLCLKDNVALESHGAMINEDDNDGDDGDNHSDGGEAGDDGEAGGDGEGRSGEGRQRWQG